MRVLDSAQMREADRRTIEEIGIPSLVLMENAGRQVVAAMEATFEDLADKRVALICGRGNNGGDGFVVARTLRQRGMDVAVFLIGRVADVKGDARVNLEILGRLGITVVEVADEEAWELHASEVADCGTIVDAIFGTGLARPLDGMLETVVADLNGLGLPIVSIDLPSGLSGDSAEPMGPSIDATMTVTLAAPKVALVLPPADARAGDLVVADIGIPVEVLDAVEGPRIEILTRARMRELIGPRPREAHKGDFGRVLVVAGSLGKTGAAHLAARGALRSGAGLVTIATPRACLPILAAMAPEYMTEPLADTADGTIDFSALDAVLELPAEIIAVGPGIGTSPSTVAFMHALIERSGVPLLIDADGLNAFAGDPDRLRGRDGLDIIVTPHPGEMARLLGISSADVQKDRMAAARRLAVEHQLHVVLKGHRTLVATPEGDVYINLTGNPGMATGGTGDVLTGVVAGWFVQLLDAQAACALAVYLHGLAGDLAEADEGEVAMTAVDVAEHLGDAVLDLTARRRPQVGNLEPQS